MLLNILCSAMLSSCSFADKRVSKEDQQPGKELYFFDKQKPNNCIEGKKHDFSCKHQWPDGTYRFYENYYEKKLRAMRGQ